jgi:type II secretory pathway component PulC
MNAIRIALNVGSLVLVGVLGWTLVRILLGVVQPQSLYAPDPIVEPVAMNAPGAAATAYDFSSDPFSFGEIEIRPIDFLEDVPETTLDLKLKGIVSQSSATFRMPNGKDKPVKIAEEIMNGVTLEGTARDFVTLGVDGETQKLTLERIKLGEKNSDQAIIRTAAATPNLPSRDEIENLFAKLKLSPSSKRGPDGSMQMQGFRINARPGADLARFNLKSGDILTRVGPVLLDSTTPNIRELRDSLTSGAARDFEVIRDGTSLTIQIGQ